MIRRPPRSTLFPSPTLSRSARRAAEVAPANAQPADRRDAERRDRVDLGLVAVLPRGEAERRDQRARRGAADPRELRLAEIGRARVGKECRSRWSPYH